MAACSCPGVFHPHFAAELGRQQDRDRKRLLKAPSGDSVGQMGLAYAARSPQVEILHGGIELPGSFIGEPIAGCDLKFFEGELPIRLLAAEKLNQVIPHREGALFLPAALF